MEHTQHDQDVGSSISVPIIVAAVVALVLIVGGFLSYRWLVHEEGHARIVIATGSEGGTYHALGVAAARVFESEGVVESAEVLTTAGSVANMKLLSAQQRGADLAFVQGDTPATADVRLVASLYDEVLHIVVKKDAANEIKTIFDLRGRRVALGEFDSGTRQLAEHVLEHFRVQVGEDLALGPQATADALVSGTADAAFILTAIPSRLVAELAQKDAVRFLSLGDAQEVGNEADALALVIPSLKATTIPRSTYVDLPTRPVCTVSVQALLVAPRALDPELVHRLTAAIFEHRPGAGGLGGEELVVASRIRESYQPGTAIIPYHRGAIAYYERSQPPFFVQYAEAISLGLTLLVGLYSGYIALREWMRRRMKNRIDAYLLEVEDLTDDLRNLSLEELVERRDTLDLVRQRAFSDLVSERLLADESFTIFQDHLRSELASIEARILEQKSPA